MKRYSSIILFFVSCTYTMSSHAESTYVQIYNQGYSCFTNADFDGALRAFKAAKKLKPTSHQPYYNIGLCYHYKKQHKKAIHNLLKCVSINPEYTKAYTLLATLYEALENTTGAIDCSLRAIALGEKSAQPHAILGKIYLAKLDLESSIHHLKIAYRKDPHNGQTLFNLISAKSLTHEYQEALELSYKLEKLRPGSYTMLYNIAHVLRKLGRIDEALYYYRKALACAPNNEHIHYGLSQCLLLSGQWDEGWREYEWRWIRNGISTYPPFKGAEWDGSDLHGKTIYLRAEQSIGDQFQFVRYAKVAKDKGACTIVSVSSNLIPVFKNCPYIDILLSQGDENIPPYDVCLPFASCPRALNTSIDTVPNEIPYLYANKTHVAQWKEALRHDTNFRIGLCWQGNPFANSRLMHIIAAPKSIPLSCLEPLFVIPGTSFYSLQINKTSDYHLQKSAAEQVQELRNPAVIHLFDDSFDRQNGSFVDSAAVISNLDLVITVDTSVCHFAAALGAPTWLLLSEPADWRWLLDRDDSPWYPNMRLFRQKKHGDWAPVVERIEKELRNLLAQHSASASKDSMR